MGLMGYTRAMPVGGTYYRQARSNFYKLDRGYYYTYSLYYILKGAYDGF